MKNKITILFVLITSTLFAQGFQGTAIYQWKQSSEDFKNTVLSDPKMDPAMRKVIEDRMSKLFNKTFVLNFDKNISVYKEEKALDINKQDGGGDWSPNGIIISYYKNIKTKQSITQTDLMSKIFNVQNSLADYKWELSSQTKQIGSYLCYKATTIIPVTQKEKADYEEEKAEQEKNNTQFFKIEEPKDKTIIAWYTPEIPVSNGPENYFGLPGLILEVNAGKTTLLCSKIAMNIKDKKEIKAPTNAKVITQKKYDEIVAKKMDELNHTHQDHDGNGGMQIRMGR
ncbi:GLPGLI family protein [Flavobacterium psychrophilum]